jgi:hypothetical protein
MALLLTGATALLRASTAHAIGLPDNSSGNCAGPNGCFRITNSNSIGPAITGILTNAGSTTPAVNGNATAGAGVQGTASGASGVGVIGSTSGIGAYGVKGLNGSSGTGVFGNSISGVGVYGDGGTYGVSGFGHSATSIGVYGYVAGAGTGSAIYGNAEGSFTAWAGDYNGDVQARGFYNSSDARLKKEIKNASYGLDEVMKLRPVSYKWKDGLDRATHNGFLAQEVQKIFPEVVRANGKTGMMAVDYTALIPVAIKAIQQQEARIKELESRQAPLAASALPMAGLGGWAALALLPVGIYVRRRQTQRK